MSARFCSGGIGTASPGHFRRCQASNSPRRVRACSSLSGARTSRATDRPDGLDRLLDRIASEARREGKPQDVQERRSAGQSDGRLRVPPSACASIAGVQRIHHVAVVTSDYGRLLGFYRDAFDAVGPDAREQPSVADVGTARLHVFEEAISADAGAPGRLHHPT